MDDGGRDIAFTWAALCARTARSARRPPPWWRPDIAAMATPLLRDIVWCAQRDAVGRRLWWALERQLATRPLDARPVSVQIVHEERPPAGPRPERRRARVLC